MTQIGRPTDIEEWSNRYVIHKAADKLLPILIGLKLTPNIVSLLGFLCASGAGLLYFESMIQQNPFLALAGLCCALAWHIFDGSDGKLARATGRASEFGRVIDGICDYASFAAVYTALSLAAIEQGFAPKLSWTGLAVAGFVHAVQAASFERRRQSFSQVTADHISANAGASQTHGVFKWLILLYSFVQKLGNKGLKDIEDVMRKHGNSAHAQEQYRLLIPSHIRRWSVLSANHRTFLIFLCVITQMPIAYFAIEILLLSAVHIWLLKEERKVANQLRARLSL